MGGVIFSTEDHSTVPQGDHLSPLLILRVPDEERKRWKSMEWHSSSRIGTGEGDVRWYKDTALLTKPFPFQFSFKVPYNLKENISAAC